MAPGHFAQIDTDEGEDSTDEMAVDVQTRILAELKKVNALLDVVEDHVAGAAGTRKHGKQESFKNKVNSQKSVKSRPVSSKAS